MCHSVCGVVCVLNDFHVSFSDFSCRRTSHSMNVIVVGWGLNEHLIDYTSGAGCTRPDHSNRMG